MKKIKAGWVALIMAALVVIPLQATWSFTVLDEPAAASHAAFETNGETHTLADYDGERIMLWLFSTWCSSCKAAAKALSDAKEPLEAAGLKVIALQNYENGGYQGPSVKAFFEAHGPQALEAPNWSFGKVPMAMSIVWNPRRFPDIYYLINEDGQVVAFGDAPAIAIDQIVGFARSN